MGKAKKVARQCHRRKCSNRFVQRYYIFLAHRWYKKDRQAACSKTITNILDDAVFEGRAPRRLRHRCIVLRRSPECTVLCTYTRI